MGLSETCNLPGLTDYSNSPCPPGFWCSGFGPPILCPAGTKRPHPGATAPSQCVSCAGGTFCPDPRVTGKPNVEGVPCRASYQCPMGAVSEMLCRAGSYCGPQTAEPPVCPKGYFCPEGSHTYNTPKQLCPFPYYCPANSSAMKSCKGGFMPVNTSDLRGSKTSCCHVCEGGTYRRHLSPITQCLPCPPGYFCYPGTDHYKSNPCPIGCQCEQYVSAEELCNTSCLSRLPQLSAQFPSDGHLLLCLKERDKLVWSRTVINILGPDIHAKSIGKIHLIQFGPEGVFGWIPTQKELIKQFLSEPIELLNTRHRKRRDMGDAEDDNASDIAVLPRIPNPIVCLSSGDMLLFHLAINHTDRHLSHFPVYQKDHLFNSNPSWDFGAFRRLQILMKQTNLNSTRFAHVFSETGKYVFVDSAVPDWSMVVVVSEEGTECAPRASALQPMTPAQLVKYGIMKQHRLNLLPDWGAIAGTLSLLLVVVVVLTTTVLVLRPDKAKLFSQRRTKPKWRSLGEPFCPVDCVCSEDSIAVPSLGGLLGSRGVGEGAEAEEPAVSRGGSVPGRCNLEELNVKTLFDKLEDQNLHIASQLARHRKDTHEFYRNICQQAETIKNVFDSMDHKKMSLLKELLVHNAMRDKPSNSIAGARDAQAETSVAILGAVLRSVEALVCRLTGESWQNQDLPGLPYCQHTPLDARECEEQAGYTQTGDNNMCYTQFSSVNLTKADRVHLQSTAPCLSDHDLSRLVSISPLFKTLQEIQQSLQNLTTAESNPQLHNATEHSAQNDDGQFIPTALDNLSPQHSAVFLFGCQVMQLLANCPLFPSVLLLMAKGLLF
ncbi:uncharacterized protein si:ch211-286b4.4 [Clinocottus analis]|uniref:uncharacterized protein si:ch211-286b4.4 n=1 Tax=Clinocottus analis TaxID=304258 RepID=UPI0035C0CFB0